MNSQVKGVVPGVMDSTRQNISAAFVPFLDTFLPSLSEGTAKENETKMKHCSLLSMFLSFPIVIFPIFYYFIHLHRQESYLLLIQ